MKAESWRVLIDCGAVQTVSVTRGSGEWIARSGEAEARAPMARAAVTLLAGHCGWAAVEIRGPGEMLTREARKSVCGSVSS